MSRVIARASVLAAVPLLFVACSSGPRSRPAPIQQRVITTAEINAVQYPTAYDVVQALRPLWLNNRGRTSITQRESVKVYLDDSLLGEPEQLKNVTARSISSMRFLDANEATLRWGLDHGQGAIMVRTLRDSARVRP